MKKILVLFFSMIVIISCFASCQMVNEEKTPPTNQELITEKIETFLTAYNTGDMEGVLQCLDAKTRNALQAMLNIIESIAGSYIGFEINLSDLFSLGVNTTQGDFMGLEITEINIIDSKNANVITIMNLTGVETQIIYFEMVYEKNGWYIHDMTDHKQS